MSNSYILGKNARWVGHGFPGGFELSGSVVTSASLDDPKTVNELRARLDGASSLELLSCFVADGIGKEFVRKLAHALGVSVFASSRAVGPAHLGGTYFLDYGYCPDSDQDLPGLQVNPVPGLNILLPLLTVPFTDGFIGQRGANNQQNKGINIWGNLIDPTSASDLYIDKISFSQQSTTTSFMTGADLGFQGNDVPGFLTIEIQGETFRIDGYIGWQDKDGGKTQAFGFLPGYDLVVDPDHSTKGQTPSYDPQFTDYRSGGNPTYDFISWGEDTSGPDGNPWDTNYGLLALGADTTFQKSEYTEANDIQGSADLKDVLNELNSYLTYTQSLAPSGPVSVETQSTTNTQPTICGEVTLQAGETFTVTIDGIVYDTNTIQFVSGTTGSVQRWCVDLSSTSQTLTLGSSYEVIATITDANGEFTKSDSTQDEVTILGAGAVVVNDISVNEGSPGGAVFTVNAPPGDPVSLAVSDGTAIGVGTPSTLDGTEDFDSDIEVFYGSSWQLYADVLANNSITAIPVDASGTLYVRFKLVDDSASEGDQTFQLQATNTVIGGMTHTGTATIKDDGTGSLLQDSSPPPTEDTSTTPDDDRPLSVSDETVNEASDNVSFTITSVAGAQITDLTVIDKETYGLYDNTVQYWDEQNSQWVDFDGSSVTVGSSNELLVRVPITDEHDDFADSGETFDLKVTQAGGKTGTGTGTINDDGDTSDTIYKDNDPDTSGVKPVPIVDPTGHETDTSLNLVINSIVINEASQYAIQTITGPANADVSSLIVSDYGTTSITAPDIKVWNPVSNAWETFDASNSNHDLDARGVLFVRTDISEEQDSWSDTGEIYTLKVNPEGTVTILDDGSGTIFDGSISTPTNQQNTYPTEQNYGQETDSGSAPDPNSVGIGGGLDGWCGWIGTQTNLNDGYFQTFESTSGLGTVIIRYYDDGSSEFIT